MPPNSVVTGRDLLFDDLPETEERGGLVFKPLRHPIWTENKAKLIARYLYYFVLITKHGAYIDGFAAPQQPDLEGTWAAKLVLESEPKFLRNFWLCDKDRAGCEALEALAAEHRSATRTIEVLPGDFNVRVNEILASGQITDKTAAFCLLDQRTFECDWATLKALANHKEQSKIELFYFLASGWLNRSMAASTTPEGEARLQAWWGRQDWNVVRGARGIARADLFCNRFRSELGYSYAHAWPIYGRGSEGPVMYHMIHGTDHVEAPKIMSRAYRTATRALEPQEQYDLEEYWGRQHPDPPNNQGTP